MKFTRINEHQIGLRIESSCSWRRLQPSSDWVLRISSQHTFRFDVITVRFNLTHFATHFFSSAHSVTSDGNLIAFVRHPLNQRVATYIYLADRNFMLSALWHNLLFLLSFSRPGIFTDFAWFHLELTFQRGTLMHIQTQCHDESNWRTLLIAEKCVVLCLNR